MGGGGSKKQDILNQTISKVALDVLVAVSSSATGNISNTVKINIVGSGSKVRGLDISQAATVNLKMLQNAGINANMQANMVTSILSSLAQKSSDFPQLTGADQNATIKNIVENNVSTTFNVSSITKTQTTIDNAVGINIIGDQSVAEEIKIGQTGNAVVDLVNTMSSSITSEIASKTDSRASAENTQTFFGADLVHSIGDAGGKLLAGVNSIFGLNPLTVILIFIVLVVGTILAYRLYMAEITLPDISQVQPSPAPDVQQVQTPITTQPQQDQVAT